MGQKVKIWKLYNTRDLGNLEVFQTYFNSVSDKRSLSVD